MVASQGGEEECQDVVFDYCGGRGRDRTYGGTSTCGLGHTEH